MQASLQLSQQSHHQVRMPLPHPLLHKCTYFYVITLNTPHHHHTSLLSCLKTSWLFSASIANTWAHTPTWLYTALTPPWLLFKFLLGSNRKAQRPPSEPDRSAGDGETQRARERGTALGFCLFKSGLQDVPPVAGLNDISEAEPIFHSWIHQGHCHWVRHVDGFIVCTELAAKR